MENTGAWRGEGKLLVQACVVAAEATLQVIHDIKVSPGQPAGLASVSGEEENKRRCPSPTSNNVLRFPMSPPLASLSQH